MRSILLFTLFASILCCTNYSVNASALNYRTGPGTNYPSKGTYATGKVLCVDTINSSNWAKLNNGYYVSASYLKKATTTTTTTPTTSTSTTSSAGACTGGGSSSCLSITQSQMKTLFTRLTDTQASAYAEYLKAAFAESKINTKLRICHFLAQVGHESGGLYYWEEIAKGEAYEGRADLGNNQPGDGVKFKGRGPIQITGRSNYEVCGKYLGLDLINNPSLLAQPQYGFRSAAWFWQYRSLNGYADSDDITTITKRVNGGINGLADRQSWLAKAKSAYGI